ncbi:MAG: electron transfer flavoprotein subunit alpha/FixB family protein [Desulfovibrionaceae bacterium]|nr:electron transfer flavoprotein subunit alpha/FixB family protein [Desulfovibrionaceae bacterium]
MANIWIVAETSSWAAVLISAAKSINAGARITAFVKGDEAAAKEAAAYGVAAFAMPQAPERLWEDYAAPLAQRAAAEVPAFILVSASRRGRDLAARVAALIDAPLFSNGKNIRLEDGEVKGETGVYGGMAVKTAVTGAKTVLVTVGAKDYEPAPNGAAVGEVGTLEPADSGVRVLDRKPRPVQSVNLGEAATVVCFGRGVTEEADISYARDLAAALGGELACSRPIAEFFKWLPEECYIGISGQVIKPNLHVAVGVSGQAQHYYGVRDAKTIVSINKDAESPMNQNADYYIVGDFKEVIPVLLKALTN